MVLQGQELYNWMVKAPVGSSVLWEPISTKPGATGQIYFKRLTGSWSRENSNLKYSAEQFRAGNDKWVCADKYIIAEEID